MAMSAWRSRTVTDVLVELHVPDFAKAKSFYQKIGFKQVWQRTAKEVDGYLVMRRGASILCFYCGTSKVYQHSYFKRFPSRSPKGYAVEITIPVKNIKIFYEKTKRAVGTRYIISPLTSQSYDKNRKRDFRIKDCFGFYLRFTDPINVLYKE